jgi:uncharacterized protein YcfL
MSRRLVLFVLAAAGLLVTLGACSARINSVIINRETGTRRFVVDNIFLAGDIRVLDVKEEEKEGALFVSVLVKNGWQMPIAGKMKVLFYDLNGVQYDDPWGWQPVMLESNQDQWLKFIAPKRPELVSKIKIMVRGIQKYSSSGY